MAALHSVSLRETVAGRSVLELQAECLGLQRTVFKCT